MQSATLPGTYFAQRSQNPGRGALGCFPSAQRTPFLAARPVLHHTPDCFAGSCGAHPPTPANIADSLRGETGIGERLRPGAPGGHGGANEGYSDLLPQDLNLLGGDDLLLAFCCLNVCHNGVSPNALNDVLRRDSGHLDTTLRQFEQWERLERRVRRRPEIVEAVARLRKEMTGAWADGGIPGRHVESLSPTELLDIGFSGCRREWGGRRDGRRPFHHYYACNRLCANEGHRPQGEVRVPPSRTHPLFASTQQPPGCDAPSPAVQPSTTLSVVHTARLLDSEGVRRYMPNEEPLPVFAAGCLDGAFNVCLSGIGPAVDFPYCLRGEGL